MSGIDGTYRPPAGGRPFEPHSSGKRRTVKRRQTDRADRRRSGELQPHHAADRREAEIVRTCASGGHRADARSERPRTSEGLHRRKRRRHARTFGDSIRTIGITGVIDRAFESLAGEIGRRPARKTVVDRITAARRRIFSPQRDRIARRPPHLRAARAAQRRPGLVDPGMYLHKRRRLLRRTQRRLRLVRFDPLATDRCEQDRNEIKPSHRPDPINPPTVFDHRRVTRFRRRCETAFRDALRRPYFRRQITRRQRQMLPTGSGTGCLQRIPSAENDW